ncbi:MAG: hotdog fold thioesterase [Apibacter sp.]|uniref:hotdog fold thioesterase n=1 Tax=Apibacter sp. TaxID=2023709 RepID=UPI0025D69BF7|nr:hotdog fold thioesterase [Apibacter sp.]MCT6869772.1 hotdog fold thioesterase [Apibacter sp.]
MNKEEILFQLNASSSDTLMQTLGIVYTDFTGDTLTAEMDVTSTVHQPMRFLHGGASLAMAETVGSFLSITTVNISEYHVFGTQVNGYHLKSVKNGKLTATAKFINKGKTSHIVEISIYCTDENGNTFKNCHVTMTNRIVPKNNFA